MADSWRVRLDHHHRLARRTERRQGARDPAGRQQFHCSQQTARRAQRHRPEQHLEPHQRRQCGHPGQSESSAGARGQAGALFRQRQHRQPVQQARAGRPRPWQQGDVRAGGASRIRLQIHLIRSTRSPPLRSRPRALQCRNRRFAPACHWLVLIVLPARRNTRSVTHIAEEGPPRARGAGAHPAQASDNRRLRAASPRPRTPVYTLQGFPPWLHAKRPSRHRSPGPSRVAVGHAGRALSAHLLAQASAADPQRVPGFPVAAAARRPGRPGLRRRRAGAADQPRPRRR